jgi:hypothetical protein
VLFCDDFDGAAPRTGARGNYFEVNPGPDGGFAPVEGAGLHDSRAMRAHWKAGQTEAGALHLLIGRTPDDGYRVSKIRPDTDFREIYWRQYVRTGAGWTGGDPGKLSRAFSFASPDHWGQAMIAHVWGGPALTLDPASGIGRVDGSDTLRTTQYNDGANLRWLGARRGASPIFGAASAGRWFCLEAHVRLDRPGRADGVMELWIDGRREAGAEGLEWVGTWADYGINAVYFENFTNPPGSPVERERYLDNLVVSTAPIGCGAL